MTAFFIHIGAVLAALAARAWFAADVVPKSTVDAPEALDESKSTPAASAKTVIAANDLRASFDIVRAYVVRDPRKRLHRQNVDNEKRANSRLLEG
jgi:hypothetical protein